MIWVCSRKIVGNLFWKFSYYILLKNKLKPIYLFISSFFYLAWMYKLKSPIIKCLYISFSLSLFDFLLSGWLTLFIRLWVNIIWLFSIWVCLWLDNKVFSFSYDYLLDIDECESRPCMNNGICIDEVNKYNCQCMAGYTGLNCEIGKYESLRISASET